MFDIHEYQTFESAAWEKYQYVVMTVGDQKVGAEKTLLSDVFGLCLTRYYNYKNHPVRDDLKK